MAGLQRVSGLTDGVELGYTDKTTKSISCAGIVSNMSASDTKADVDVYFHKYSTAESASLSGKTACLVTKKGVKPPDNWWVRPIGRAI